MPPLKPPAPARRVPALLQRRGHGLTVQAVEALFRHADVLTEGRVSDEETPRFYGSTLVTFDLARVRSLVRGLDGDEELVRFVEAVMGSVQVRVRAHRLACGEVYARFPDRDIGTAHIESRFHREGLRLLLDVDLEVPLDVSSARRAT
ncbi:MAG: hypothetical protein IT378_16220 [Sandaracinaceae bacterium]|nr:hypothetical protein [Sandaracinaceae bacterium]MCC6875854.1 hypothetical protein [Sandaracinaceae bacterium]